MLDRVARGQGQTDRLVLDNGDELTGLIETLQGGKLKIKGNLGPVEIPVRRVVALVFNPALRQQPAAQANAAWIGLGDGARLLTARLQVDGESLELTPLSGAKWKAAAKDLVFLMPQTGRAVYLSDIRPSEYRFLPYLETKWPYKTDRNVTGGQLLRWAAVPERPRSPQRRAVELSARSALEPLPDGGGNRRLDRRPWQRRVSRLCGWKAEIRQPAGPRRNAAPGHFH